MACKNPIKIGAALSVTVNRISNEEPVDLTGFSVESSLRHPKFGVYELDVLIDDPTTGVVKVTMDGDTTQNLLPGDYIWDIVFTSPSGNTEIFPKDNTVVLTFIKGATR